MGRLKAKELTDDDIRTTLAEFESRFKMTTDEFIRRLESGELDHRREFVRWVAYARLWSRINDPVSA